MASRVNYKFLGMISAAAVVLAGVVVYFGVRNLMPNGEQNITRGKQAEKEGDLKKAISFYGRAVNKDRGNREWVKTWLEAIERYTPPTRQTYQDMYHGEFLGALRAMADADRANAAPYRRFLEETMNLTRSWGGNSLLGWEGYARTYEDFTRYFQGNENAKNMLRRFRGVAREGMLIHNNDLADTLVQGGMEDFAAALKADPSDTEAAEGMSIFKRALAERALKAGRQADAEKLADEARADLRAFLKANPTSSAIRVILLNDDMIAAAKARGGDVTLVSYMRDNGPAIQDAYDAVMATPAETVNIQAGLQLAQMASMALENGKQKAQALVDKVRQGHPNDATMLFEIAGQEKQRGNIEKSIAVAKELESLPDRPMSLEGAMLFDMRPLATRMQADAMFVRWVREADPAKRAEYVQAVKDLRKELVSKVGESSLQVLAVDGRLEFMNGDINGARARVSEFNDKAPRPDTEMLMMEALLLRQMKQNAAAKSKFERVLSIEKNNLGAMRSLAELEAEGQDFKAAANYLDFLAKALPEDTQIQEMDRKAHALAMQDFTKDPVLKARVDAMNVAQSLTGDVAAGIKILRDALAKPEQAGNVELSLQLAQFLAATGDVEGAKGALQASLAKNPDSRAVKSALDQVGKEPAAMALAEIEKSPVSEASKALGRYMVYSRTGKPDDAKRELDKAAALEPENPAVIDAQFDNALFRKDDAAVESLAAKASSMNLDKLSGRMYRARALLSRNKSAEATGLLREIVAIDKLNLGGWRLLGAVLLDTGHPVEAADALKTALGIKSDDVLTVNALTKALVAAGRENEALTLARKSETFGADNFDFREMLLTLEASVPGGNVTRAIDVRKRIAERAPTDRNNRTRLASLLINAGRTDEARTVITGLRAEDKDDRIGVQLEASLLGRENKIEQAVKMLDEYIKGIPPEKRNEELYINVGRLYRSLGETNKTVEILEASRSVQKPKEMLIDRELGDVVYEMAGQQLDDAGSRIAQAENGVSVLEARVAAPGIDAASKTAAEAELGKARDALATGKKMDTDAHATMEKALTVYQRVIDGGFDDDTGAVRKRMIEACLKAGDYDRMDKIVNKLPAAMQGDYTVFLLRARAATAQNKLDQARQLYDQAVSADPKNPMVYVNRGDFRLSLAKDARGVQDALADYEQIKRVDPGSLMARVRIARAEGMLGHDEAAAKSLKEAVEIDPYNENMRYALVVKLQEIGRALEAAQAADAAVQQFNSTRWRLVAASYWRKVPNFEKAAEHMGAVWREDNKSAPVAVMYIEDLLNKNDVTNAFNVLMSPDLKVGESLPLKMLRARVLAKQGRTADAAAEINNSLGMLRPANMQEDAAIFMSGLTGIYSGRPDAAANLADQLAALDKLEATKPFEGYLSLKANEMRLRQPDRKAAATAALLRLAESGPDDRLRAQAWSLLGTQSYESESWQEARERFERGLKLSPEDLDLNNNLAYILAVKLNQCKDALPFALKAARMGSQNSGYLDTYGAAQVCAGDNEEAMRTLTAALNAALNDGERVPVYVHMGKARLAMNDKIEARRLLNQARDLSNGMPAGRQTFGNDIKELERAIDAK